MMKYYDKKLTPLSKDIQQTFLIIAVFIIGFIAGYFAGNYEKQTSENKVQNHVNTASVEAVWYNA